MPLGLSAASAATACRVAVSYTTTRSSSRAEIHTASPRGVNSSIAIRAWAAGESLNVEVADTGQGFVHASGVGTGLANIRSRLAALFGRDASLTLRMNAPHGVVATIVLPARPAQREERDEYARAA